MKVYEAIRELSELDPHTTVSKVTIINSDEMIRELSKLDPYCEAPLIEVLDDQGEIVSTLSSDQKTRMHLIWNNTKHAVLENNQNTINAIIRWAFDRIHDGDIVDFSNAVADHGGAEGYVWFLVDDLGEDNKFTCLFETDAEDFVFVLDEYTTL